MISRAPAKASSRWAAEAATITLGSPSGDGADAVLGRRRAQPVPLHRVAQDRGDPLPRHLGVGLVVERRYLAGHSLEADDGPGARVAHGRGQRRRG